MAKKIIMACMALVALAAFALPAAASAANKPGITHPTGTLLAKGAKIRGHLVGGSSIMYSTSGTPELECNTATTTGTLLKNEGGTVEGEITSAIFGGTGALQAGEPANECTGLGFFTTNTSVTPLGLPWCLKSTPLMKEHEFQISGGKCGAAPAKIEFKLLPTGFSECIYQATNPSMSGTFTTDTTGDAILTLTRSNANSGFTKTAGGSFFCPSSSELEMKFTLETDAETTQPLYISQLP